MPNYYILLWHLKQTRNNRVAPVIVSCKQAQAFGKSEGQLLVLFAPLLNFGAHTKQFTDYLNVQFQGRCSFGRFLQTFF